MVLPAMDFGALPPEVNSLRMYSGPGSAPMLAAMAAWDDVSAEMLLTAAAYESVLSALLSDGWLGPASAAMAAAAAPYVTWLSATGLQAAQTAGQAAAAAAAFEAAFAMTVPPSVVAANRVQLLTLVATNFLGINTPAIAATEAEYAEMWAQDATAMYGYAAGSAVASTLEPFSEPAHTASRSGLAGQTAASTAMGGLTQTELPQLMSAVPASLQGLAAPAAAPLDTIAGSGLLADILNFLDGNDGNAFGIFLNSSLANGVISAGYTAPGIVVPAVTSAMADVNALALDGLPGIALPITGSDSGDAVWTRMTVPQSGLGGVAAGTNQATMVGRLSVPPSWAGTTEVIDHVATALPGAGTATAPEASAAMPGVPGVPAPGAYARSYGTGPRYGFRLTIMPRPLSGG
ncbi:putative PPE family protein PPE29 [Mycobacterium marinum]|uniref:PPE family protein n=1 Tax=Mycobacterium marinum TaxID=1781 RepID=UPI0003589176|nr:PPE family protein [Mycobacterium marinum]AXN44632.1 putative PPE family protein PPE29 [Mycobacterium marinum]AXN49993.1 putative PPE family protein PPE29 [Mycobacterium marinum]EPQ80329.1 PPE family protein [Mycobacterium marinum str. Europe]RFZ01965.1 putative PPE family protein PPE29 [Mycobacterium marinum]RFZ13683.1 putative PPE family protein PPE29 [Mycobacterium marinum]